MANNNFFDKLEKSCVCISSVTSEGLRTGTGSGSLIHDNNDHKLILTAGHVVDDFFKGDDIQYNVRIGEEWLKGYLISSKTDARNDELALLVARCNKLLDCTVLDMSCPVLEKGMPVYMSSHYGGEDIISNTCGRISKFRIPGVKIGDPLVESFVEYDISAASGSSGAAVVDSHGLLVAVHTSTSAHDILSRNTLGDEIIKRYELKSVGGLKFGIPNENVHSMIKRMTVDLPNDTTLRDRLDFLCHMEPTPKPSKPPKFHSFYASGKTKVFRDSKCHSCKSSVPRHGASSRWLLGYTCCDAFGRLFTKRNYCPVCLKVYRDSEPTPMVCCDICQRWVHCQCDGISEERYLQFQADVLQYACPTCRGECYQVCHRHGGSNKLKFCKRCDGGFHCYCMQTPHKDVNSGPYVCPKHTKCHSLASSIRGHGLSLRWFLSYTCWYPCGRLFTKRNYCPVCLKVHRGSEPTPMVSCDICQRSVHRQCDGFSEERYFQF